MSLSPENITDFWSIAAYVGGIGFLLFVMLFIPQWLGGKAWGRAKNDPFESGVVSQGSARLRLSAKFYLVAMFFVIFDVEALYLDELMVTDDAAEGLRAFLDKRPPVWRHS